MQHLTLSRVVFVGAILLLIPTYWTFLQAPAAGLFHDDGVYLVTAKSLAEGHGYRIISIPGEPVQTKYPILFPWLVSLVWRASPEFPQNLPWLRLIPLSATIAWLWISWHLLRRMRVSSAAASTIVLLTAASPFVVFLSTAILSETLFAALLTAGVLVLARIHDGEGTRFEGLLAGLIMGASLLTRAAGVAPVAAGFLFLVMSRRWAYCLHYSSAIAVVALPWLMWVQAHVEPAAALDAYNSASNYGAWNIVSSYSWPEKIRVLALNSIRAVLAPGSFWGLGDARWLSLAIGAASALMIALGAAKLWRHPAAIATGTYFALVLSWAWPPGRLLIPIAPLAAGLATTGVGRRARFAVVAVAILLMASAAWNLVRLRELAKTSGTAWLSVARSDDWRHVSTLLVWISEHTATDAIIASNLDPVVYLFSGRKAVRAFAADSYQVYYSLLGSSATPLGTVDDFRNRLMRNNAGYLVMTPGDDFGESPYLRQHVEDLSAAFPGSLSPVAGSKASGYVVYQINRERLGASFPDSR